MRVLAAVLITTWPCLAAATAFDFIPKPVRNIVDCARSLGPVKCLNALSSWRAEKALNYVNVRTKLSEDLEQFPWREYRNSSDEGLRAQLCDDTERLLQRKPLALTLIPGYRFELLSKGNGTLNFDVYKNTESGRGIKKVKKSFYTILPLLIVPGLIMSAILPFVLPAMKMLTVAAGLINNMAFTGAVFTLLRNNAFNDRYDHKVVYVNEGYKNEHAHKHSEFENYEEFKDGYADGEPVEQNTEWKYYGPAARPHDEFVEVEDHQYQYKRTSGSQSQRV